MIDFREAYEWYREDFNAVLEKFCAKLETRPQILSDSLKYSLNLAGKRIRPVLTFAVGDLLGVERKKLLNFALAIELIHTYSLIHDDLPEMDNDDFRRGQPSNHKVFGAGNAVLAGDGLLNTAYSLLLSECKNGTEFISAAQYICDCAGIYGMIAGQSADLLYEKDETATEDNLNFIYENKTAKLIIAPVVVPSILSGGKYYSELKAFGSGLGFLFQLTDDILDVEGEFSALGKSIGKDGKEGKYTAVKVYGLNGSKVKADLLYERCTNVLEGVEGNTSFLKLLAEYVRNRNS